MFLWATVEGAMIRLTLSCDSWRRGPGTLLWSDFWSRGCWHCRRCPGARAESLLRALPCWGNDLRKQTTHEVFFKKSCQRVQICYSLYEKNSDSRRHFHFCSASCFLNKEITKTACWRRGFPHIHVVGTVDWPSAATPDHWITTLARRSQPRSGPGQKQVKLDPIQSYQPEVYHTQLLKEKGVGGCSLCCCIVLIIVSRVLSKLVHIIDNTFCLLRRVQFFHSNRRIWEPVFIAPQLYPWKGSWDGNKPADTQLRQWWHSVLTKTLEHWG